MMRFMKAFDEKVNVRVFAYSALFMGLFMLVVLPFEASLFASKTDGLTMPDTRLFYDADWLLALANDLGRSGRHYYVITRIRFDILWPLVYGFFFITTLALLWRNYGFRLLLLWLPLVGVGFDLLENTVVSIVFMVYPHELRWLAHVAGFVTLFKWLAIGTTVGLVLIGLVLNVKARYQKRHT